MPWFNNLRMAPKLLGSFILVAALSGVVGGAGLAGFAAVQGRLTYIVDDSLPGLVDLMQAQHNVGAAIRNTRGAILTNDPAQLRRFVATARRARATAWRDFRAYQAVPYDRDDQGRAALAARVAALFRRWMPLDAQAQAFVLRNTFGDNQAATHISLGPEAQLEQQLNADLDALVARTNQAARDAAARAEAARGTAVDVLLAALGVAVLLAVALGILIARSIAAPLAQLSGTAARIARGDAGARIELARGDELGTLAAALRAMVADLQDRATTDHITGLGNHRAYQEEMRHAVAHAWRRGEPLALALIDLDDFKVINDQHGHAQGDRVLAAAGAVLRGLRAEDRAFRLGGDEFALLLPGAAEGDAAATLERLRRGAGRGFYGATASVGVAALASRSGADGEDAALDADTLREQADAALYEAKRRGRDRVVAFGEIADTAAIVSGSKVQAVRRLLAEGQLTVAFQPIWDLARGGVLGYEALSRPGPSYALDGPGEAFAIAEKLDHAHDLDALCRQAILARASELPADALLFLNLSPQTLEHNARPAAALAEVVAAAGLTPARVVLEITERAVTRPEVVAREAGRLRAAGFRLALDDVGAGNAGLEMLRQLPVDYVKIDRAVVVGALTDTMARAVLAAIVAFARQCGDRRDRRGDRDPRDADLRAAGGPGRGDALGGHPRRAGLPAGPAQRDHPPGRRRAPRVLRVTV